MQQQATGGRGCETDHCASGCSCGTSQMSNIWPGKNLYEDRLFCYASAGRSPLLLKGTQSCGASSQTCSCSEPVQCVCCWPSAPLLPGGSWGGLVREPPSVWLQEEQFAAVQLALSEASILGLNTLKFPCWSIRACHSRCSAGWLSNINLPNKNPPCWLPNMKPLCKHMLLGHPITLLSAARVTVLVPAHSF